MKKRHGFVSNSSSSSFLIGCNGDYDDVIEDKIELEDHPLSAISKEVSELLKDGVELYPINNTVFIEQEDMPKAFESFHTVKIVTVANDDFGNPLSILLHQYPNLVMMDDPDLKIGRF